jgi:hypothetical protein
MSELQNFANWVKAVGPSVALAAGSGAVVGAAGGAPRKDQKAQRQAEVTKRLAALVGPYKEAMSLGGPAAAKMQSLMAAVKQQITQQDFQHAAKVLDDLEPLVERSKTQNVNDDMVDGGTPLTSASGPPHRTSIFRASTRRAAPVPSSSAIVSGEAGEDTGDEASEPQVSEMSESDKAWLEANKKAEVIQRARDLGSKDGELGKSSQIGEIQRWPEVADRNGTAEGVVFYNELLASYNAGFREGQKKVKTARIKNAIAAKLKLPNNANADKTLDEADKQDDLEKWYQEGVEAGKTGEDWHPQKGRAVKFGKPLGPKTDAAIAAYQLGFDEANAARIAEAEKQAALQRAASEGYADGENDAFSQTQPQPQNVAEASALIEKHLAGKKEITKSPWSKQLIIAYKMAYLQALKDADAKAEQGSRQQAHMGPGPGKPLTPAELQEQRKWEEFDKELKKMRGEWEDEIRHHDIEPGEPPVPVEPPVVID